MTAPETDLNRLVVRYCTEKRKLGEWNPRSWMAAKGTLLDFASSTEVPVDRVTRHQVIRFLERDDLSPAYRRSRLSRLRGFCQWCVLNKHMRTDPTLGVKPPRQAALLPRALSRDEAQAVVKAASADLRTEVIVLLMLQLGLRRVEVARAEVGDIDFRKSTMLVRGKGADGGISAALPLTDEVREALRLYVSTEGLTSAGPLIVNRRGTTRGIAAATVGHLVLQAFREAGVKSHNGDGRSAHALRHTCAQDLFDAGVETRVVQKVLRHASIRNTEIYLRGEVGGLREAMEGRRYSRPPDGGHLDTEATA